MRNKDFRIIQAEDYDKAYKQLENFCLSNTNVLLIGEFGNASFPSISDLDIFICLKDENFEQQRQSIIQFIDSDDIRQYLFFHDPLIIPESLLPYLKQFHTLYNLQYTFRKPGIKAPESDSDQLSFLNIIWTTYLMGIGPGILINPKISIRDKLLVLKNVCQSISNIQSNSKALLSNKQVRDTFLERGLSIGEVDAIFKKKLDELFKESNQIYFEEKKESFHRKEFRISRNKLFIFNSENRLSIKEGEIRVYLNSSFFNLFTQFYRKESPSPKVQNYIHNSIEINQVCKKMNTTYPFIAPFGYPFYRSSVKFYLKKIIYSL